MPIYLKCPSSRRVSKFCIDFSGPASLSTRAISNKSILRCLRISLISVTCLRRKSMSAFGFICGVMPPLTERKNLSACEERSAAFEGPLRATSIPL